MDKEVTSTNNIILYLYGEQEPLDKALTEAEFEIDGALNEQLQEYKEVMQELDQMKRSPSDTSVKIILDYARQNEVESSY